MGVVPIVHFKCTFVLNALRTRDGASDLAVANSSNDEPTKQRS